VRISGIGILTSRGLGMAAYEQALLEGWRSPQMIDDPRAPGRTVPAYRADLDSLPDKTMLKKLRRADRVSKMAVLAALDALADSGSGTTIDQRTGIIVATAFGAHGTTFGFLDDILDYGDAAVSPTTFSNSVHNAAASYVSSALNVQGPTLTMTQFSFSFQAGLQLAGTWLEQGQCDQVLVGAVDQYGEVLGAIARSRLPIAADGRIRPFDLTSPGQVPGEGAVFFLLRKGTGERDYCSVERVLVCDTADEQHRPDLQVIDAGSLLPGAAGYRRMLVPGVAVACYTPLVGSMMIASAFNTAAAALMLKKQQVYASPVPEGPDAANVVTAAAPTALTRIRCFGADCSGGQATIELTR